MCLGTLCRHSAIVYPRVYSIVYPIVYFIDYSIIYYHPPRLTIGHTVLCRFLETIFIWDTLYLSGFVKQNVFKCIKINLNYIAKHMEYTYDDANKVSEEKVNLDCKT